MEQQKIHSTTGIVRFGEQELRSFKQNHYPVERQCNISQRKPNTGIASKVWIVSGKSGIFQRAVLIWSFENFTRLAS